MPPIIVGGIVTQLDARGAVKANFQHAADMMVGVQQENFHY